MTAPCQCDGPNAECTRAGRPMVGRYYELCSGTNCTLELSEGYRAKWDRNGNKRPECIQKSERTVGVIQKANQLEQELAAWTAAGKPRCTDDELEARLAICHAPCQFFRDGKCGACGCGVEKAPLLARMYGVATGRGDVPGKAEMRTSDCPKGYWPKLNGTS